MHTLDTLRTVSPYANHWLNRYPQWLEKLPQPRQPLLIKSQDESALMAELRLYKHESQIKLLYALLNQTLDQSAFLHEISQLASDLVQSALDFHFKALCTRYGTPLDKNGNPQNLTILGMGKLGGFELNFSSDIDLIFTYQSSGEIHHANKTTDFETFYRKLAQKLIATLDNPTEHGFVYRVDMRLRPFGQSGPLALSHDAMEQYYLLHGRDWERYALMKARPIAGDIDGGLQLLKALKPFIYRRYLDYAALRAIVDMKHNINEQIKADGMERHLKLGAGGIREAEFAVQAMQMVYGGQYPRLQQSHFQSALQALGELEFWNKAQVEQLQQAYLVLRSLENALQFKDEQQTHQLPDTREDWERLALACGYESISALKESHAWARRTIHEHYQTIFAQHHQSHPKNDSLNWQDLNTEALQNYLKNQNLDQYLNEEQLEAISQHTTHLARHLNWHRLPEKTIHHLNQLLPRLLRQTAQKQHLQGLMGILELIEAVASRSTYIDLLASRPELIAYLFDIAQQSAWLMRFICEHPLVLDDILQERHQLESKSALAQDLNERIQGLDDENFIHALRDFKHAQVFKIAWADLHQRIGLMEVSDRLSDLAELTLAQAYHHAQSALVKKHGYPRHSNGGKALYAIVGYGKLGGLELGYGSDLDLLFVFDDGDGGETDGTKSIDNLTFFTRLSQRILNILSAASQSGVLYQTDTRLRPSGQSGPLACNIQAFARYQAENAWTWEHQALTRSRWLLGDEPLKQAFNDIRHHILTQAREPKRLREEVLAMREKMHANQPSRTPEQFHLKHDKGGLIDVEFMVQYLLLKHSHQEPVLTRMSDNIRQLAALEATGILSSSHAMTLRDAYRRMRNEAHHCTLGDKSRVVSAKAWADLRQKVQRIWAEVFAE